MFFKTHRSNQPFKIIAPDALSKTASVQVESMLEKQSRAGKVKLNLASNFYLQNWAVSSLEKWGYNDNFDAFERAELQKSYPTFIGSWACLDHENHHVSLAVGENVDAAFLPEDYVQIVMGVNRKQAEARRPGIEKLIESGKITDTSMGCIARESVCSVCDNVAFDETQYCDHIGNSRGQKISNASTGFKEVVAFEKNRGVVFFEDSIITDSEGADRNAKILAKLASMHMSGPKSIPADKFYKIIQSYIKTSSREEKAFMTILLEQVAGIIDGR